MLFPSQFNITKIYLELEHDALKKEFSDVLNSEEYVYVHILYIYIYLYIYIFIYKYIHIYIYKTAHRYFYHCWAETIIANN